ERRKGKTDWARVDAMTEEEIEAAIAGDPDWDEFKDIDWSNAVLVMPTKKKAISIRVDEDVLDFFKREGEGYQRRMNAVLRSYMQQKSKPKKRAGRPLPVIPGRPKGKTGTIVPLAYWERWIPGSRRARPGMTTELFSQEPPRLDQLQLRDRPVVDVGPGLVWRAVG